VVSKSAFSHFSMSNLEEVYSLRSDRILGVFRVDNNSMMMTETYDSNTADRIRNEIYKDNQLRDELEKRELLKKNYDSKINDFFRNAATLTREKGSSSSSGGYSSSGGLFGRQSSRVSPLFIEAPFISQSTPPSSSSTTSEAESSSHGNQSTVREGEEEDEEEEDDEEEGLPHSHLGMNHTVTTITTHKASLVPFYPPPRDINRYETNEFKDDYDDEDDDQDNRTFESSYSPPRIDEVHSHVVELPHHHHHQHHQQQQQQGSGRHLSEEAEASVVKQGEKRRKDRTRLPALVNNPTTTTNENPGTLMDGSQSHSAPLTTSASNNNLSSSSGENHYRTVNDVSHDTSDGSISTNTQHNCLNKESPQSIPSFEFNSYVVGQGTDTEREREKKK
jgi:hypothetical protein